MKLKANESQINIKDGLFIYFNYRCELTKYSDLQSCEHSPQQLNKILPNKCKQKYKLVINYTN